jgi:hypothetical protein
MSRETSESTGGVDHDLGGVVHVSRSGYAGGVLEDRYHGREDEIPEALITCCMGSAARGLGGCTCWQPEHEVGPEDPHRNEATPCADCAFRAGSPESSTEDGREYLAGLVRDRLRFWCHQGMRRVRRWRHPSGVVVEVEGDAAYAPEVRDGVPHRADGRPASECTGWRLRCLAKAWR